MGTNTPPIICALCACTSWASATTIEPMPVARLANHAAVVVDAVVESVQSHLSDNPREIVSEVRFASVDYWKGTASSAAAGSATMSLTVPGGTVATMTMRIAGAPEFAVGQRWVLFVLPEYRVFPVVGLWNGAFRVERDALGVERVHDASGRAVIGLDMAGHIRTAGTEAASSAHLSCAAADSVDLAAPAATATGEPALSVAEFKGLLTPILTASRVHSGATAAGRRIPTQFTATSLVPAPAAANMLTPPTRFRPSAPEAPSGTLGARNRMQKPGLAK